MLVANRAASNDSRRFGKEKGAAMKFATISKTLLTGLALLLATSAFAATKAHLALTGPTNVNGTTLKAGDYQLQWEGSGPNVEVSILQGKNLVTKVNGRLVDLKSRTQNDAAIVRNNADGTASLTGARFSGKTFALELGDSEAAMQMGSSK